MNIKIKKTPENTELSWQEVCATPGLYKSKTHHNVIILVVADNVDVRKTIQIFIDAEEQDIMKACKSSWSKEKFFIYDGELTLSNEDS